MSIFCHPRCKMGVHLPSHALCRTNNKTSIYLVPLPSSQIS